MNLESVKTLLSLTDEAISFLGLDPMVSKTLWLGEAVKVIRLLQERDITLPTVTPEEFYAGYEDAFTGKMSEYIRQRFPRGVVVRSKL